MKKIFILGGSSLQLDLILEAKKMFFYTIVLDMDKDCVGSKWCDEFLHINIADKEAVLQKAKEYKIDVVLTSATELGNLTACYIGEKLGLNTNSYQTALATTNKILMKEILVKHNIQTASYMVVNNLQEIHRDIFPCIVKPADSSAGRGLSYCTQRDCFAKALEKGFKYSATKELLIEEYIEGEQFSIETISCNGVHQIVAINREFIHDLPNIMEVSHTIPAQIDRQIEANLELLVPKILDSFHIKYGAAHIETRIKQNGEIYVIEIASRTGGMRSEMINLSFGINYSQLLLLASLNNLSKLRWSRYSKVTCNFILDYQTYEEYIRIKNNPNFLVFEPFEIPKIKNDFQAEHIGESKGYYFILETTQGKL
jgi:biotin carboxylase